MMVFVSYTFSPGKVKCSELTTAQLLHSLHTRVGVDVGLVEKLLCSE